MTKIVSDIPPMQPSSLQDWSIVSWEHPAIENTLLPFLWPPDNLPEERGGMGRGEWKLGDFDLLNRKLKNFKPPNKELRKRLFLSC